MWHSKEEFVSFTKNTLYLDHRFLDSARLQYQVCFSLSRKKKKMSNSIELQICRLIGNIFLIYSYKLISQVPLTVYCVKVISC